MTTKTSTKARPATRDERQESALAEVRAVDTLVDAFKAARAQETENMTALEAAKLGLANAYVFMARSSYLIATHPQVLTKRSPVCNYSAASKLVGMARNTLRPYIDAGLALSNAGLVESVGQPTDEERAIVQKSFDDGERARKREERAAAKAEESAVEESAGEESVTVEVEATAPSMSDVLTKANELLAAAKLFAAGGEEDATRDQLDRLEDVLSQVSALVATDD